MTKKASTPKAKITAKKVEEVVVTPEVETEVDTVEEVVEAEEVDVDEEEDTLEVEEPTLQVEVSNIEVDESKQAVEKNTRIKMLVDHKCVIGGELYELAKEQCYNVPLSVKLRLNKAGVLMPL